MPKLRIRVLAGIGAAIAVVVLTGVPAYAGTITTPSSNPYSVPYFSGGDGGFPAGPEPFKIVAQGYTVGTQVFVMICDGNPSSAQGWSPTINCDNSTSPQAAQVVTCGVTTCATWDPAVSNNQDIVVFDGEGPGQTFNCYYPGELDNGVAYSNGQIDPSDNLPSWTNCQIRVASTNGAVTSDQAFITLTLPAPPAITPEAPYTFLLPIGAALMLGGAYLVLRRRRRHSTTPAA